MENIKFLAKYPFLEEAKKYISEKNLSLEKISSHPIYSHAIEIARKRVEDGINGEIKYTLKSELDYEFWLISYPIAKILINLVPHMIKKYADSEANIVMNFLEKDEKKEIILKNVINYETQGNLNKIYFIEYLKHAGKINDEKFRLVNRKLEKGYLLIDDSDLMKLAREGIRKKFEARIEIKNIPEKFKEIAKSFNKYENITALKKEKYDYPPCITSLILRIKTGEVAHQGRFLIATYLINTNLNNEKIIKIFSESPKFDEKKTTYYINYLSGVKGKKYSCPTCAKIKSFGLCVAECGIKHPLQYEKK